MPRVKVTGHITDGVGDFRARMTRFPEVFARAAGESLFPGTLNVDIGAPLNVREDFRIRGSDIGEPGQDLLFERCIVAGHRAFRIRPFQLKGGGGGHGDRILEIACRVELRPILTSQGETVEIDFPRDVAGATMVDPNQGAFMSGINMRRVVLGGFVAGLVANAFDFIITQFLMANEFAAMLARLNVSESAAESWIAVFAAADFLWGFLLVFTYASIRPRFGPGPKTAIVSGVLLWMAFAIAVLILMAIGLHTLPSYLKSAALYLIAAIVSSVAGAALYKES